MCAYRKQVAGTVLKLVYTKGILVHFCAVAGTVCKSNAHNATLKIEVILYLLRDAEFKAAKF